MEYMHGHMDPLNTPSSYRPPLRTPCCEPPVDPHKRTPNRRPADALEGPPYGPPAHPLLWTPC
eukprot:1195662-Prorocentrum_minimum.AAC.1